MFPNLGVAHSQTQFLTVYYANLVLWKYIYFYTFDHGVMLYKCSAKIT